MSFTLLPTPRTAKWGRERVAVGPGSPITGSEDDSLGEDLRALTLRGTGTTPIVLSRDQALPREGFRLNVSHQAIELASRDARGRRYGIACLRQLATDGFAQVGEIIDAPSLPIRGYHLNFRIPGMNFDRAVQLLGAMAQWRLNTALVEYDARYPYAKHRTISAPDALTRDEVVAFLERARQLDIELIPLHQCLGHVDFILKHPAYAHLQEESQHRDQFCPTRIESLALLKECVDDYLDLHPGIRYFHLGGDEARRLGSCPKCAQVAAEHGTGRLYVDYMIKAAQYVLSRGLTPILWDDMLCAHRDVIAELPREIVIMYWDYWTVQDPSAIVVARPDNGRGIVADKRWMTQWRDELGDVERRMIEFFAQRLDMENDLSADFRHGFAKYLGSEFPKRIRAFPYLEYYRDLGFKVVGAPTGGGNTSTWRGLPDFPRYADNIGAFCRRLDDTDALGVVTTAWYNFPPDALLPGLMYTGQFAWNTATLSD